MGVEVILDRGVRRNCSEKWHLSKLVNDQMAWALQRYLAEGAKALGPEQAWHIWEIAKRPACFRESNGGCAPSAGVDMVGFQEGQLQVNGGFTSLSVAYSCSLLVHTIFIYLESDWGGFPISTLLIPIEIPHFPIGIPVPPFTGCQYR